VIYQLNSTYHLGRVGVALVKELVALLVRLVALGAEGVHLLLEGVELLADGLGDGVVELLLELLNVSLVSSDRGLGRGRRLHGLARALELVDLLQRLLLVNELHDARLDALLEVAGRVSTNTLMPIS
jgi:hypothetical protein